MPIPLSILDLSFVREGETPAQALRDTLDLAQHAERWGYRRFWLAEHHNMDGIASAATAVAIGYIAGGTSTIRVGAGGIMLPNHAPLVVAEQFGTLESLYPGRIDLGLGRAPGTDRPAMRALRRDLLSGGDKFPDDVQELQSFFAPAKPGQLVQAVPGAGLNLPLYILGSSDFGARLAAELGLPFAFASHFAPTYLDAALEIYRKNFRPSETLSKPYAIVACNVIVADSEAEATSLFTTTQLGFLGMVRGTRRKMIPPLTSMEGKWTAEEEQAVGQMLRYAYHGSPTRVRKGLEELILETGADELITVGRIYDQRARLRSFELLSELGKDLNIGQAMSVAE